MKAKESIRTFGNDPPVEQTQKNCVNWQDFSEPPADKSPMGQHSTLFIIVFAAFTWLSPPASANSLFDKEQAKAAKRWHPKTMNRKQHKLNLGPKIKPWAQNKLQARAKF